MKNGAKEPYNTCSISRIRLIKLTIANSEETKKQLTSNIHHLQNAAQQHSVSTGKKSQFIDLAQVFSRATRSYRS